MRRVEQVILCMFLTGLAITSIGLFLYLKKLMAMCGVDLELQLAVVGLLILLLSLIVAKVFSKVERYG